VLSLALAITLLLGAPGAEPRLAAPPWPLSPDGELVAAPPGVPLEVTGGTAEPVALGLWRVLPGRDVREVSLRAGPAQLTAAVAPPAAPIEIGWSPAAPVKGRDATVVVELGLPAATGGPEDGGQPPRLVASAGRLGPVERVGPGRFRATYELPATRHPEVVALFALVPRCPTCATPDALGVARLPLAAAIVLPGETEPGVSTYVEVGGTVFGPVTADRAGRFRLPVVVPPGVSRGVARSVSAVGNERRKPIDLGLPPAPRLACIAQPDRLPADGLGRAAIACLGWTDTGEAETEPQVALATSRGALTAPWREGGMVHAAYRSPHGGAGPVEVTGSRREAGAAGRAVVRLELVAGGPAWIDWTVAGEPLRPGEAAAASAVARDAQGDPLGPARAEGAHAGEVEAGRFVARATLGDGLDGVALAFAHGPVPASEAATLTLRWEGPGWLAEARSLDGRPAQGVELAFGSGHRAVTDERGEGRAASDGPDETVTGPAGLRAAGWAWAPPPRRPVAVRRQATVALRPPGAVDVEAAFDGRFVTWVVRGAGEGAAARPVLVRPGVVRLGPPEVHGQGGRCAVLGGRGPVAIIDAESGVAAVVEVP